MILYLGHSVDGVDYSAWTVKPRWVLNEWSKRWHWHPGAGCTIPCLKAHQVERFLGRKLAAKELVILKLELQAEGRE